MAHLPAQALVDATRELAHGGRWTQARALLDAGEPSDPVEAGALAGARAEVEVEHAFWMRRTADLAVLATAEHAAADDAQQWAARFARLRAAYAEQLHARFADRPHTRFAGQSLIGVDDLAATAAELASGAPDGTTRAYVTFYRGLIADVLLGDPTAGARHYQDAAGTSDEYVRSYALRHLGGVADDAGRRDEALAHWRESTRLRQRAGFVPGALAQLQLYPGETTTAQLVNDWAEALGVRALIAEATEPEVARDPV
jgi:tetratricopeptide (TPR) repeat protein